MAARKFSDDQILAAIDQAGTQRGAAALLGLDSRGFERRLKNIREGRSVDAQRQAVVENLREGQAADERVRGRSTLYDAQTGEPKLEWVRTARDDDAVRAAIRAAFEGFSDKIPRARLRVRPKIADDNLLACFVITDYHLGSLAWGEETGDGNWDLAKAEDLLVSWFESAIAAAPPAKRVVLAQLGDACHYDSLEAVTPGHGHVLDSDTRLQLLARTVIRVMRRVIDMLSQRYEQVHVIYAEGNHDLATSAYMREWLAAHYEAEQRVTVDTSPDPYYAVEHGDVSLFFHHGHLTKPGELDRALAGKFRPLLGRTTHSYAHVGHLHHKTVQESSLMTVEQHQTLAAATAFESRHGYKAGRSAQVITYHKHHGEVGRVRLTPEMIAA
jgi:hypothetical protein